MLRPADAGRRRDHVPRGDPRGARATRCARTTRVFLLGEDIGAFGGAFGVTAGLREEFGEERVLDTPISEEGFVGAAIGAAWMGERPVVELQFADFITCAFDPIVTVAAKTHWRSGHPPPGRRSAPDRRRRPRRAVPRRLARRAGSSARPGSRSSAPATVEDAYGLLRAAIDDDDPVLYFEHKAPVPARCAASCRRPGTARRSAPAADRPRREPTRRSSPTAPASRIALAAAERVDADVEMLDLRTVWPLDDARRSSTRSRRPRACSCSRRPSRSTGAAGADPLARRREVVRAPRRAARARTPPPDTPVPFAPELEDAYLPSVESTSAALEELLAY